MLTGKRILLGVCGGIAAYKACELARQLLREGAGVQVVLTPAAAEFVTPLTFSALTGKPAWVSEFENGRTGAPPVEEETGLTGEGAGPTSPYLHLDLTRDIDCFVIAPATAGTIGKLANGAADNLLTSCYLSCTAPVVIAPAMNVRMWEHNAVQANMSTLRARGHVIVDPCEGELACGDVGAGRLAEVGEIAEAVRAAVGFSGAGQNGAGQVVGQPAVAVKDSQPARDMSSPANPDRHGGLSHPSSDPVADPRPGRGYRIILTAGGTREYLDPVRFITNNSTGALGIEICRALVRRGAAVDLIETGIEVAEDVASFLTSRIPVSTAFDLQSALQRALPDADALVMLAAVADYGPTRYSPTKRKKDGAAWTVELAETPDVLKSIAPMRQPGQVFVGVSLEDEDWLSRAQRKCAAKGCDAMLAVELTGELPYGERRMHCALVTPDAVLEPPAMRSKMEAATMLADWLASRLGGARIEQAGRPATQSV